MTFESVAELVQFTPDTYGLRYRHHVSIFITTPEGVILIDPCGEVTPRMPYLTKEAIRSVTEAPVRYVVYSHAALDHAQGGIVFKDTATFVSQQRAAEHLGTVNEPTTPLPDVTFDDRMQLELGGTVLDLYASKLTPTENYLYLHYPAARILTYVDFIQPESVPLRLIGHPTAAIDRLTWLLENLDFDYVLSGHASPRIVTTRAEIPALIDYYRGLLEAIESARKAGLGDDSTELKAAVRAYLAPRWGEWRRFAECLDTNIQNTIDYEAGRWLPPH